MTLYSNILFAPVYSRKLAQMKYYSLYRKRKTLRMRKQNESKIPNEQTLAPLGAGKLYQN